MNKLLEKYFSKELSHEEQQILFAALETDDELKKEFVRLQSIFSTIAYYKKEECSELVAEGWKELQKKKRHQGQQKLWITVMKYAAAVCLTFGLSWFMFGPNGQHSEYTEIMSPEGQRTQVMLADGSEVWLSPLSKLKIPTAFDRQVELEGEGFFTVAHNARHPFIVNTRNYNVKVLGTKFNVFAYSQHPRFEVNLLEGSVCVYHKDNESDYSYLNPQEKVVSENGNLVRSKAGYIDERYIKEGIFDFQSIPVSQIVEYLSLWYNIRFEVEDGVDLSVVKVSGKIRQSDRVDYIMKAILASGDSGYMFRMINDSTGYIYK